MKLKISKKGLEDIEGIWLYTVKNWSVEQADRYYNSIFSEIDYLLENPASGKDYDHLRQNYRCSKIKNHLIFYRVTGKNDVLEIIRVLHQRMDFESRLDE